MEWLSGRLRERLAGAYESVAGGPVDPVLRRSPRADFQSDAALALARRLGGNPREIAARVVDAAELGDLCERAEVSGPGFINLTVRSDRLAAMVTEIAVDERGGVAVTADPETVVIDYAGPNAAKELHIGHMRSTIIGDALARLLEWQGHRVIRRNHLGDWGTPFGMLLEQIRDEGGSGAGIADLTAVYQRGRRAFDEDAGFRERARRRVVSMQAGDEETLRLWRAVVAESQRHMLAIYAELGVTLTAADFAGESSYNAELPEVVAELDALGLLRESEGALCAFPPGFAGRSGEPLPLIVRKSDGGFGYPATDLAAVRDRVRKLGGTRLVYVVGTPQAQHFAMVFAVARQAGWLTDNISAEFVGFGQILGADGKKLASRSGAAPALRELMDEAIGRAGATVGLGAVKYADLSNDRTRDYLLDFDRMLALDGNTAPYLQYAHARICSVFRKAGDKKPGPVRIDHEKERALALALLRFPDAIAEAAAGLAPHKLAGYLFELASTFTAFYEHCPVLTGPAAGSRLTLCAVARNMLATGLSLLGIEAPERM